MKTPAMKEHTDNKLSMREAFEAWLVGFRSNAALRRFENGEYVSAITENYFSVWQAALSAVPANHVCNHNCTENGVCTSSGLYSPAVPAQEPVSSDEHVKQESWISIEDRLPEANMTVLVVTNFDCIYTCRLPVIISKNAALDLENGIRERFTHWMPLPLPPVEVTE